MNTMSKQDYFKWLYTSFQGRIGRKTFWLYFFLPVLFLLIIHPAKPIGLMTMAEAVFALLCIVIVLPCYCAGMAKRLHDLGKSGWWMLIAFIPFIGILFTIIVMGIIAGDNTTNKYGEPEVIKNA